MMSASENLLPLVKKSLLIPETETFADLEITALIDSALALVKSTGVSGTALESKEVATIVIIYVKTFFGFQNDGSVKELPEAFYFLLKQVSLTKGT